MIVPQETYDDSSEFRTAGTLTGTRNRHGTLINKNGCVFHGVRAYQPMATTGKLVSIRYFRIVQSRKVKMKKKSKKIQLNRKYLDLRVGRPYARSAQLLSVSLERYPPGRAHRQCSIEGGKLSLRLYKKKMLSSVFSRREKK